MYIHYPGNSLGLRWTIYRGLSRITEDFESATLTCVLYSKDNKFPVEATVMSAADGGSYLYIELSPELQLPDGIYGVSAIWKKNEDRSIARSMREGLFSVVNNQEEATDQGGAANIPVLKFHSSAGTFGYDGLSAYELALLKGLTTKSETEWVQEQLDVATDQIFDAKDEAVGQAETAITAAKDVAVGQAEAAVVAAKDAAVSAANTAIGESKEDALGAIAEAIEGLEVHYDIETDKGAVKDVQLKDGQGNKLMPKTSTDGISVNLYDSEKNIQQYLNDTDAIKHQCIFDGFIQEPGAEWSRREVAVANKYDIDGYVTKIYFYAVDTRYNACVEYGILDITGSEFVFTLKGTAGIGGGLNIIELPEPIKVDPQHLLGFKNITYALTFQTTGSGSYYDNTYTSSVSWKYYFDYVTTLNNNPIEENNIQDKKIEGGYVEASPSYIGYNQGTNAENPRTYLSNRWVVMYEDAEPGDILEIDCGDDYLTYPFILNRAGWSELKRLLPTYVGGYNRVVIDFKATHDFPIKVLLKNSANTNINQTDVRAKVSVKLYKKYSDITNTPQKEISILFIGNSLTQDAVSYLPYLLNKYPSGIKFKFYVWYVGGFTLSQHLQYFQQDTPCAIFSVSEGMTRWVNYNNEKTMSQILQDYRFDVVCLQEYFNYKNEYSDDDKQVYEDVIKYIADNHPQDNLKFITLFHQPKRDVAERVFNLTKSSIGWIMQNTITEAVLAPGIAIYRALSTSLDVLGDRGHLSPDGTHAQEGLPCVMQSYTILMWIYEKLGIAKSVYNMLSQPNTYDYTYINVPGPNIGSGLVTGTEEQLLLAQNVAIKAYKEGKALELANLTPYNS